MNIIMNFNHTTSEQQIDGLVPNATQMRIEEK